MYAVNKDLSLGPDTLGCPEDRNRVPIPRASDLPVSNRLWQEFRHGSTGTTVFLFSAHFDLRETERPIARVVVALEGKD